MEHNGENKHNIQILSFNTSIQVFFFYLEEQK